MSDETEQTKEPPLPGQTSPPRDDRRRLRVLVRFLLYLLAILVLVRVFVFEPYGIPFDSPSMEPTILPGDVMLVNKLPYVVRSLRYLPFTRVPIPYLEFKGIGTLERGDVVVFDFPTSVRTTGPVEQYVKRCVAVTGDTVQIVGGRVRVNGREVTSPGGSKRRRMPIELSHIWMPLRDERTIIIPYKGMIIPMDSTAQAIWKPFIESEGLSVEFRNHIVFVGGLPAVDYVVRRDYFFALGDNSSNSRDSRVFGFVPYDNLIGRAWRLYWSRTSEGDVRWSRIGKPLN